MIMPKLQETGTRGQKKTGQATNDLEEECRE